MKVHSTHTYAATPERVLTVMTDPDVLHRKYEALGHRDVHVVDHVVADGEITVRTRRSVPMTVPGFAKRFLAPMNDVEQIDHWNAAGPDGVRTGTWQVTARGVPVSVGGTLRLAPDGHGATVVDIDGEVRSSVPLVGGKLADHVGHDVERTMEAEESFNTLVLGRRRTRT
jgi:hypothetical protein